MANVRIQPSRALEVYKSDNADIPYPAVATSGTTTANGASQLIDAGKNFPALQIYPGNIVYNTATGTSATIIDVSPATPTILTLNANIFAASPEAYIIYQSSPMAGGQNTGCVLYVGTGGDVKVTTAGNDVVTFVDVQNGSFLPVQVVKVWNIGASADILALW
jgi:hypothetical protein